MGNVESRQVRRGGVIGDVPCVRWLASIRRANIKISRVFDPLPVNGWFDRWGWVSIVQVFCVTGRVPLGRRANRFKSRCTVVSIL